MATLREVLQKATREGELYEKLDRGFVRCFACGHCCRIPDGQLGVCKVRYNEGGELFVPWGYVSACSAIPLKKSRSSTLTPARWLTASGCWAATCIAAIARTGLRRRLCAILWRFRSPWRMTPEELVQDALQQGAKVLVSTYNEPLITSEWAVAVFKEARLAGLKTGYVSNGNGTPQVLEYLRPWVDLYKVDLKSFNDRHYRQLGGRLQPILDTIRTLHEMGFWVEIVTLVVPGFNDSDSELERMAEFLVNVSPDIPWHVTAFHKDYKMTDPENTGSLTLVRAARSAKPPDCASFMPAISPGAQGISRTPIAPPATNFSSSVSALTSSATG